MFNDNQQIVTKQYPTAFLEKLFEHNIRKIHTKIELLSWDERVLKEIQGIVKEGSYSADGSSKVRRTLNLTFSVLDREGDYVIEYLTPDKKIMLYIGLENFTGEYPEDPIIWFQMGVFILNEPSFSHSVDNAIVTISAQDKMTMMNGTLGGKLMTPVSFLQRQSGELVSLSWREIFLQAATLFGNEDPAKVVIDSVPDYINEYTQVKSVGGLKDDFIHINAPTEKDGERIIVKAWSPTIPETEIMFSKTDRLYKLRRFGPNDPKASSSLNDEGYIKNVGETVTSIFDDIVQALSNTHEYFYTKNGDLIFQPIKNYINQVFNPEEDPTLGYFAYELQMEDFIPNYLGLPFTYDFSDKKTIASYNNNPTYTNIKNDFVATGKSGQILEIAIDNKPTIQEIKDWFIGVAEDFNADSPEMSFIQKDGVKREAYSPITNTVPFELKEETAGKRAVYIDIPLDKIPWQIGLGLKNYFIRNIYGSASPRIVPRWGQECESMIFKWTASLDKKSLLPNTGIFNPGYIGIGTPWLAGYPVKAAANTEDDVEELDKLNPIFSDKGDTSFWMYYLDLIDSTTVLGKYSIDLMGKRSINVNSEQATVFFRTNPKELVVVTESELALLGGDMILTELKKSGQSYAVITDISDQMFKPTVLNTNKEVLPYSAIIGDPSSQGQLYYSITTGTGQNQEILVGGKFDGSIGTNVDIQGKDVPGNVLISASNWKHPITKHVYRQSDIAQIPTPFPKEDDLTEFAFIAYIENKGSRCPNSGGHDYFAVIRNTGTKWFYAQEDKDNATWKEFTIRPATDVIVGTIEQNVYKTNDYSFGSNKIDVYHELFTIRDSKLSDIFVVDGGVDLFSSVRNLIYQHTNTADVISLSVLPVYTLEPNTLIYVEDEKSSIKGMYMITSLGLQMNTGGSPLMNISAIQANPRI